MTMRKVPLLLCALLAATLLVACGLADLVGGSRPDPCDAGGALLYDDFSGEQECGWAVYNRGGAVVDISDGALRISTSQPGQIWWTNPGRNFNDVVITVQARQVSGPNDNAYGVICRYQNTENFYIFLISGDGFYAIGKYQSGGSRVTYLSGEGEYQFSEIINQGVATNQIRASCIGNELSLAVNGLPLATVTDPSFVTGDIGLGVSTLEPGTAVVHFDEVRVLAP
jgi:hypothetical protein